MDYIRFAERLTTGLLGLDTLYRAESGDGDGLVVLNMDGAGAFVPEPFASYDEARLWFASLATDAAMLTEPDRRVYGSQVCASTLAFIEWRNGGLPFRSQLSRFLRVPARPASDRELDVLRETLYVLLGELGCNGSLAARCAAWESRNRVAPDEAAGVLEELLDRAWDRTEHTLLAIPSPRSDGMRVATTSGEPYNARCDYLARTIELNTDPTLTRPGLKHLAAHEGCPGHYVQFRLRETAHDGGGAADGLLSVVNTASSSVFEGIADAGMEMIDWIDSHDDRVQALLNRYRAGIATVAAWRLHAERRPVSSVTAWLRSNSLVGGEGWVMNRMRFIASPSRAVLIWSYWWGEPVVAAAWRHVPANRRAAFLQFLYGRMHSIDSVGMFA